MALVITGGTVLYGGYDVSGEASVFTPASAVEILEHRPFNSGGGVNKESGLWNDSATLAGVLNTSTAAAAGRAQEMMSTALKAKRPLTVIPAGTPVQATQHRVWMLNPINVMMDAPIQQGGLWEYTLNLASDADPLVWGHLIGWGTKTVTGVSETLTLAAIAAGQTVHASLHAFGTLTGTFDLTIESADAADTGFASPTTHFTFTQVTTSVTGEYLTKNFASGDTDTLWRASWTSASTPSHPVAVSLGVAT